MEDACAALCHFIKSFSFYIRHDPSPNKRALPGHPSDSESEAGTYSGRSLLTVQWPGPGLGHQTRTRSLCELHFFIRPRRGAMRPGRSESWAGPTPEITESRGTQSEVVDCAGVCESQEDPVWSAGLRVGLREVTRPRQHRD